MAGRGASTQYMLVASNLMKRITAGEYPPGSLLPTEHELCAQFNVSRITVRGGLRELETRGFVSRKPGVGTRVEQPRVQAVFAQLGDSLDEVMLFTKGIPMEVLDRTELTLSPRAAVEAGMPAGQRVVRLETLRRSRGAPPLAYSNHFIPALLAPAARELKGLTVSLASKLAELLADEITEIDQQFVAVTVRRAEALHLQCKPGSPGLRSRRCYYGRNHRLLLVSVSLFPGDRFVYQARLRRNQQVT